LPVYVRYYPNGALNARVYHEDVSEELQASWAALFKQRGSLTLDKIKFNGELFKDDAVDIQGLSVGLKRERLIQYLTGNGVPKRNGSAAAGDIASAEKQLENTVQNSSPAIPDEAAQEDVLSGTADTSMDIHIGFWIEQPKVRVYAFTKTFTYPDRTDLRICYRAHRKDADGPVFEDDEKVHRFWRYGGM
jgi:hypothetical protein